MPRRAVITADSWGRSRPSAGAAQPRVVRPPDVSDGTVDEVKRAGDLGIAQARVVVPRAPERSVLVARLRLLDERRMPNLASRVLDEAGLAAVETWIRELASCS